MDFSLRDAFTDGAPKATQDSLVKRDFMAGLEAQTYDDKVGETVGKTDYPPPSGWDGWQKGRYVFLNEKCFLMLFNNKML